MTNNQIIFNESVILARNGIIKTVEAEEVLKDGSIAKVKVPEEIHTYEAWKSLGYQVQRGQKAVASFPIWKYTMVKKKVNVRGREEEEEHANMFLKTSAFFSRSQVKEIQ